MISPILIHSHLSYRAIGGRKVRKVSARIYTLSTLDQVDLTSPKASYPECHVPLVVALAMSKAQEIVIGCRDRLSSGLTSKSVRLLVNSNEHNNIQQ